MATHARGRRRIDTRVSSRLPATADPVGGASPEEARAFATLASAIRAENLPEMVTVQRLDSASDPDPAGLLVQSPEPIRWDETTLSVSHGPTLPGESAPPKTLKVTGAELGSLPDQHVSVLVNETTDLTGYAVDHRRPDATGFTPSLVSTSGVESFDANTLDSAGFPEDLAGFDHHGTGTWTVIDGELRSESTAADGASAFAPFDSRTDGVWRATVSAESGTVGLLFRTDGDGNGYRFAIDASESRLVRIDGGAETELWRGETGYVPGEPVALTVVAEDGLLRGSVDDVPAFVVTDLGGSGDTGVYCRAATDARFRALGAWDAAIESHLLAESFADAGAIDDWTVVDEPPSTTQTSNWHVAGGQLHQTSNIYGFAGGPYRDPGTYAVAVTDDDWHDYRVSVRIMSGDDDAVGIIARHRDNGTFYRLSMDAERGYRRLIRVVDDETTLLWEADTGFDPSSESILSLDCVGDRLTGYLNGAELFSLTDPAISSGRAGVYCRANRAVAFHELRVTAPAKTWIPYHVFDADREPEVLPAGTELRLSEGVPPEPAGFDRQRSHSGIPLVPTGTELRVREPDGVGHARGILPQDAFSLVTVRWLRSADGTGVALVPNGGVAAGTYRLRFSHIPGATAAPYWEADDEMTEIVLDVPTTPAS